MLPLFPAVWQETFLCQLTLSIPSIAKQLQVSTAALLTTSLTVGITEKVKLRLPEFQAIALN
jgi:hypothetical protein